MTWTELVKRAQDDKTNLQSAWERTYIRRRAEGAKNILSEGVVPPALVGASTLIPFYGPFVLGPLGSAAIGAARRGEGEGVIRGAARGAAYGLTGAVAGGGLGMLIGRIVAQLLTHNQALGALLGGPIGMAVGTAIGAQMAGQEKGKAPPAYARPEPNDVQGALSGIAVNRLLHG